MYKLVLPVTSNDKHITSLDATLYFILCGLTQAVHTAQYMSFLKKYFRYKLPQFTSVTPYLPCI